MNYKEFREILQKKLLQKLPLDICLEQQKIRKNNGILMDGLVLRKKGEPAAPIIYEREYYELYQKGISMDMLVERILEIAENSRIPLGFQEEWIRDFDKVKDHIFYKLVHTKRNRELLEQVPNLPFLDMSVVFQILLPQTEPVRATILISNAMLQFWKIPISLLYHYGKINTPRENPVVFQPMSDLLNLDLEESEKPPVYVLTNEQGICGASVLLYEECLQNIHHILKEEFYILPSSIHEVLILPRSFQMEPEELRKIVQQVNETELQEEDILSEEIYWFQGETIEMFSENQ